MIEREDGPVKHYRMVCNLCRKQTKRHAYEFNFKHDAPAGWKELSDGYSGGEGVHHCPQCANSVQEEVKEIVPKVGNSFDVSDHDAVYRPLIRRAGNVLEIDLQDGCKLVITSNTFIKVEQHGQN